MKRQQYFMVKILLTLCIFIVSGVPGVGYAADITETESVSIAKEDANMLEKLEAIGAVLQIPQSIDGTVTRGEAAKIICTYMNIPFSNVGHNETPFVDVPLDHDALGAVTELYRAKVISGNGYYFYPEQNLTYTDAIVMVVNALGYKGIAQRNGGYPAGYHIVAGKFDMLKKISMQSGNDEITLRDMYKLLDCGLEASTIEMNFLDDDNAEYSISDTETYLSTRYHINSYEGIVTAAGNTSLTGDAVNYKSERIEIDGKLYTTPGYDFSNLIGRSVKYYLRNDDAEIVYAEEILQDNNLIRVEAEDLIPSKSDNSSVYYYNENDKEKKINFAKSIDLVYNGRAYIGYGSIKNVLPSNGYVEALDNNGDDIAEILFIYEYKNIVVDAIDNYDYTIKSKYTRDVINADLSKGNVKIYLMPQNKQITDLQELARDDVLSVMESKGDDKSTVIYVSRDVVSGMVSSQSDNDGACINGTYYKKSQDCAGEAIDTGMTAEFYLDFLGKIAAVKYASLSDDGTKYAVVSGVYYDADDTDGELQIRLYTEDGEFLTLPFADNVRIDNQRYKANGVDRNAVISTLCNSDTGKSVYKAYVVRFKMKNDAVVSIDTGKTGKDGNLNILMEDCGAMVARMAGSILFAYKDDADVHEKPISAKFKNNEIIIFVTPSDGKLSDLGGYAIQRTLRETYYRPSGGATVPVESINVYSLNTEDTNYANVLLFRGSSTALPIADTTSLGVIQRVNDAVNDDGIVTKMLYFNKDNSPLLAERVRLAKGNTITEYDCSDNELLNYLQPGTIVRLSTNSDGWINEIQLMAAYDQSISGLNIYYDTAGYLYNAKGYGDRQRKIGSGTVTAVDNKNKTVTINIETDVNITLSTNNSEITVYRSKEEEATAEDTQSIVVGDNVVYRVDDYSIIKELIVIR